MARDIEADVKINDKTSAGLKKAEENVRKSGKTINKEFEKFGTGTGDALIKGIGSVAPKLAGRIAKGVGEGAKLGAPLLISGITAALPAISSLLGSAIAIGGVGAGVLAGVTLAARDSRVKEAGTTMGQTLLIGLQENAGAFVQPVLQGIEQIKSRFIELRPTIKSIFDGSSRFVAPLTDALLDVGQSLLEGIDQAIANAGPVIDSLVEGLSGTGEAIKGLMDDLTANGEANARILTATFDGLNGTITVLGATLGFVRDIFAEFDKIAPLSLFTTLSELFGDTDENARRSAGGILENADAMQRGALTAEQAEKSTQLYEKALKDNEQAALAAASAQRSLFDDLTAVGEAEDAATEALKKNGKTLDANTEKGRANRSALSRLASAYNTTRGNMEKAGKSTTEVNGVLNTQRARLIEAANKAGVYGRKARELADQLLGIKPRNVDVKVNSAAAAANARNVREEIANIKGKTVTIGLNVTGLTKAREAVNLRRELLMLSTGAGGGFGFAANDGGNRVGGARPVQVESSVAVNLDGRPFRQLTTTAVDRKARDVAFRSRVGRRDDGRR
jgi:hypothetical protein